VALWPASAVTPACPDMTPSAKPFDWAATVLSAEASDPPASSRDGLAAITAPTPVIAGGPDSHVNQDRLADMAARIPGGQLITIPAGHLVHAAQPARFTSAVAEFLADSKGPADPPA
jgi:3-oxoadipate enol-lactonase